MPTTVERNTALQDGIRCDFRIKKARATPELSEQLAKAWTIYL
jgi:hypothetical protein